MQVKLNRMTNAGKVKVGIIGSQFAGDIHAAALRMVPDAAEVVAVASPTPGHAEELAKRYEIPRWPWSCSAAQVC